MYTGQAFMDTMLYLPSPESTTPTKRKRRTKRALRKRQAGDMYGQQAGPQANPDLSTALLLAQFGLGGER